MMAFYLTIDRPWKSPGDPEIASGRHGLGGAHGRHQDRSLPLVLRDDPLSDLPAGAAAGEDDDRASEAAAGDAGAVDVRLFLGQLDQVIDLGNGDFVVVLQRLVGGVEELAQSREVS